MTSSTHREGSGRGYGASRMAPSRIGSSQVYDSDRGVPRRWFEGVQGTTLVRPISMDFNKKDVLSFY